jgi:hypothetical protein
MTDIESVICGRDALWDLGSLTKPEEESVDHDVHQNWFGVGTLKELVLIIVQLFAIDDTESLDSGTCDRRFIFAHNRWEFYSIFFRPAHL